MIFILGNWQHDNQKTTRLRDFPIDLQAILVIHRKEQNEHEL